MTEKSTDELLQILHNTHPSDIGKFLEENKDLMIDGERRFSDYMREIMRTNNILQQEVFLNADIPERYGYKLISEEKRTKQRDVILRICYAAGMTLAQTQTALKIYEMPQLYARIPRDALLMICFNERPGNILDVNSYLKRNGMMPLRSCGTQE